MAARAGKTEDRPFERLSITVKPKIAWIQGSLLGVIEHKVDKMFTDVLEQQREIGCSWCL